jgi:anthraniloyl-CoA monooxygenase
MFTPFTVRGLTLRTASSCRRCACTRADGVPGRLPPRPLRQPRHRRRRADLHRDDRVAADARITPGCAGSVTTITPRRGSASSTTSTRNSPAKMAIQLGHAGRKGSTKVAWEGADEPLARTGGWPLYAPVAAAVPAGRVAGAAGHDPRRHLDAVIADHVAAASAPPAAASTARAALRARLPAVVVHLAAHQPARRRLRRRSREPLPLPLEVFARCARCGRPTGRCRCGCRRTTGSPGGIHRRRRGRDRPAVQGRRLSTWSTCRRPDVARRQAGLWPHVPDALQRPHPQRGGHRHRWRSATSPSSTRSTRILAAGRADLCALARPHLSRPALDAARRGRAGPRVGLRGWRAHVRGADPAPPRGRARGPRPS